MHSWTIDLFAELFGRWVTFATERRQKSESSTSGVCFIFAFITSQYRGARHTAQRPNAIKAMASVHPSRLGLVPAPTSHSLPARPPPQSHSNRASTSSPSSSTHDASLSREEELRRKLMSRKRTSASDRLAQEMSASAGMEGERVMRGKELIGPDDRPMTIGILGRASRQRDEQRSRDRSRGSGRGRSGSRTRDERDVSTLDEGEEVYARTRREDSDTPQSRQGNDSPRGREYLNVRRGDRRTDRRNSNDEPSGDYRRDDRGDERARGFDSQRLRDDYATWKARHDRTDDRQKDDTYRGRPFGGREEAIRGQNGRNGSNAEISRELSRRSSPSYRPDSRPDRGFMPENEQGRVRPPIWLNPGGAMPPFPPNRRLGPADFEQ